MTSGDFYRAFVSFNLKELPADLTRITAASLSVYQTQHDVEAYGHKTGKLMAQSLTYGAMLNVPDWEMAPHQFCWPGCVPLQAVLSSTPANGWKTADVLAMVTADWNLRAERGSRSQFRLQFEEIDFAPGHISANFNAGEAAANRPLLKVTFEYP